jgi:hypothetical protein
VDHLVKLDNQTLVDGVMSLKGYIKDVGDKVHPDPGGEVMAELGAIVAAGEAEMAARGIEIHTLN